MKNKSLLIMVFSVIGFCFLSLFFIFPRQPLFLVAKGMVPVFQTKQDAMPLSKEKALTSLIPQQKVRLISCIDVKHYLIYEVRLDDGKAGFVNEGDYLIQRDGKPSVCR